MKAKDVRFSDDARQQMVKGVNVLADAVKATLGPKGRNALIFRRRDLPISTKDGVTVAEHIKFKNQFEDMGAQMVKEVASQTNETAGDGTSTGTVLAQAIIHEGMKTVAAGLNPMDVKRGIDLAVETVVAELKKIAQPVDTTEVIAQVGAISANSDVGIGQLIADAMDAVGYDGVITVEEGQLLTDELKVVDGMQFDSGLFSPFFITDEGTGRAEYDDALVLISAADVQYANEIIPVLDMIAKSKKPLMLIAPQISNDALRLLATNKVRGNKPWMAVQAPGVGQLRDDMLADIATMTGATVVSQVNDLKLKDVTLDHMGTAKRVLADRVSATIISGGGDPEAITARAEALAEQAKTEENPVNLDLLKKRRAKLVGGVAVLRIGASTEVEMTEKKYRIEDALNATRAAVEEGIVPGGGVALVRAGQALKALNGANLDQQAGITLLAKAIEAPLRAIVRNAGEDDGAVLHRVLAFPPTYSVSADEARAITEDFDLASILDAQPQNIMRDTSEGADVSKLAFGNYGYNAATGEYGDLIAMGVIDPVKVTRCALQNAASVASLLITTEVMIAEIDEPDVVDVNYTAED